MGIKQKSGIAVLFMTVAWWIRAYRRPFLTVFGNLNHP